MGRFGEGSNLQVEPSADGGSQRVKAVLQRFSSWLPQFYAVYAAGLTLYLALVLPAFQSPDEFEHFLRATQVAHGGIVGTKRQDNSAGGFVDKSLVELQLTLGDPARKASLEIADTWRWSSDRAFSIFTNTVLYPPVFYLPAAAAIAAGRVLDLSILTTLTMSRLATGFAAIVVSVLALRRAKTTRYWLCAVLSLPVTLSLFAACTQDALIIASAAWLVASLEPEVNKSPSLALPALVMGLLISARPPYLPLVLLLPLASPEARLRQKFAGVLPSIAAASTVVALWILFGAAPVKVQLTDNPAIDIGGQVQRLLSEPWLFPLALVNTLSNQGSLFIQQIIGVLGALEVYFPRWFYGLAWLAIATVLVDLLGHEASYRLHRGILLLATFTGCFVLIAGSLYLSWTPIGDLEIQGIQGRYLVAPLLALALMGGTRGPQRASTVKSLLAPVAITGLAVLSAVIVPRAVSAHFQAPSFWIASAGTLPWQEDRPGSSTWVSIVPLSALNVGAQGVAAATVSVAGLDAPYEVMLCETTERAECKSDPRPTVVRPFARKQVSTWNVVLRATAGAAAASANGSILFKFTDPRNTDRIYGELSIRIPKLTR